MAEKNAFILTHLLYSSPEKVFDALTLPELIEKWGGGKSEIELKAGGNFKMFDDWVHGKVIRADRGKKLSYTWKPSGWGSKKTESIVEIDLKPHVAGTEIILKHSGFPDEKEKSQHREGWIDMVFDPLNDFLTSE